MKTQIREFLQEEEGVTALEYGILAAIVALLIATVFKNTLSQLFKDLFGAVTTQVNNATGSGTSGS